MVDNRQSLIINRSHKNCHSDHALFTNCFRGIYAVQSVTE